LLSLSVSERNGGAGAGAGSSFLQGRRARASYLFFFGAPCIRLCRSSSEIPTLRWRRTNNRELHRPPALAPVDPRPRAATRVVAPRTRIRRSSSASSDGSRRPSPVSSYRRRRHAGQAHAGERCWALVAHEQDRTAPSPASPARSGLRGRRRRRARRAQGGGGGRLGCLAIWLEGGAVWGYVSEPRTLKGGEI
jgi:hypothetical protein